MDLASNHSLTVRSPVKNMQASTKIDNYRIQNSGKQSPALTERHGRQKFMSENRKLLLDKEEPEKFTKTTKNPKPKIKKVIKKSKTPVKGRKLMEHNLLPYLADNMAFDGLDLLPLLNKGDKYLQVYDSYVNPAGTMNHHKHEINRAKKTRSNSVMHGINFKKLKKGRNQGVTKNKSMDSNKSVKIVKKNKSSLKTTQEPGKAAEANVVTLEEHAERNEGGADEAAGSYAGYSMDDN